ncbi:transmembrane protein 101-like [Acanthaster planci]|uniref:Transmembrane protein 101-like n=1 Tax=Acanthaster planci TaxID=133434 RepID=A0A8B7ZR57_ACAPL|nr:transmembrane protein 101-like [Acanthaster planci]
MAAPSGGTVSRSLKKLGAFVLTRFPFLSAVIFVLLCNERERNGRPEGYPHLVIYLHVALLMLEGSMMSFATQRSLFALMCAVQMTVMTLVTHTSPSLRFKPWLMVRMMSRDVGVIGSYLILASRTHEELSRRYRLARLYPLGRSLLASYFIVLAYQVNREALERQAFLQHIPGGIVSVSAFCGASMLSSMMFLSQYKAKTSVRVLLALLLVSTLTVDLDFAYWKRQRVEFWNQVTILLNDAGMLGMLLLLAT